MPWLLLLLVATSACQTTAHVPERPVVEPAGNFVMLYQSPVVRMALSSRYSSMHPGQEWLVLELGAMGQNYRTAELRRDNFLVIAPDGRRYGMATQREFLHGLGSQPSTMRRIDMVSDPLSYFPVRGRSRCILRFFADARRFRTVYDQVTVTDRVACRGRLYFNVPDGVQPGTWLLLLELDEEVVRIPFVILPENARS